MNLQHDIIEGEILEHFSIPGEGFTYENGCPVLPAITRLVVVPPEAGVELVVNAGETRRVDAAVGPVICEDENYMIREEDAGSDLYPSDFAKMGDPIVIRGIRMVPVTTYPVQYDNRNNCYLVRDRIETELVFTEAEPVNPAYVPNRRNRSPELLKLMRGIFLAIHH